MAGLMIGNRNQLRIIGGAWRGRKLQFPDVAGLRPTADRVRETLFNWLQPSIAGARCLDLFAGSGALGLEALSRGAAEVVFVDRDPCAVEQIKSHINTLSAQGAQTVCRDGLAYLRGSARPFDIVFLDPPYHQDLLRDCVQSLASQDWLAHGAAIYLESESDLTGLLLPEHWQLIRHKRAGQVHYGLAQLAER